jgi:hypothetical protein
MGSSGTHGYLQVLPGWAYSIGISRYLQAKDNIGIYFLHDTDNAYRLFLPSYNRYGKFRCR